MKTNIEDVAVLNMSAPITGHPVHKRNTTITQTTYEPIQNGSRLLKTLLLITFRSPRQKINKEMLEEYDVINQIDLADNYRPLH